MAASVSLFPYLPKPPTIPSFSTPRRPPRLSRFSLTAQPLVAPAPPDDLVSSILSKSLALAKVLPHSPLSRPRSRQGRGRIAVVQLSFLREIPILLDIPTTATELTTDVGTGAGGVGYSPASYYTSLGLFVISVPGLWSLIKRSVKSKIVQKTFIKGATATTVTPNQVAGEILSFFTRNNFTVSDRGEAITFEGMMVPSRGQAALLTFCTCISLASVGLVLSIAIPEGGNSWFWLTALSPLAGIYYWKRASRKEQIKVKMLVGDDGNLTEIIVRGDDQQAEQMRKELQLREKGMIYVKGLFEQP